MFARSTTIRARQEAIDAGIAYVRDEVMPAVLGMDGCVGLSMLVDRQGGRCIATSAWRSEEAMTATEEALSPMRDRVGEMLGGQPEMERWEIALLHRDHTSGPGACVRATWVRVEPADLDNALQVYRTSVLAGVEVLDGFCSASMLVVRGSGRCVSSVTFDSMASLERSRQQAASIRDLATREARATVLDVCEFELALAHLRVPEMA